MWRSRFSRWFFLWVFLALASALAWGRLTEVAATLMTSVVMGLFLLPVLPMLFWSLRLLHRQPRTNWPAPVAVLLFCALAVAGLSPLMWTSTFLNFMSHKATYDRIVADAKAGRLAPNGGPGWTSGRRYGVDYYWQHSPGQASPSLQFNWGVPGGFSGIIYDEVECPPGNPRPPPSPPLEANGDDVPTIKNAGRLGTPWWWFGEHYCFVVIVS